MGPEDVFGDWHQYAVLIVDDEPGIQAFLTRALAKRCRCVEAFASVEEANRRLSEKHFELVILDNAMPGKSGVEWLTELRAVGWHGQVILITAYADIDVAIAALRAGASDFILKPFRTNQILNAVSRSFERARLRSENFALRQILTTQDQGRGDEEGETIVGMSSAMANLRQFVRRLAPMPSTVLITGESGTGKEVVARALHDLSPRAERPFVPLNCGAIPSEIIESELFGHVKGAYSGAASSREGMFFYAQGGTIFLDEIGELPLLMQSKLLRVLEDKKIRPVGAEREIPVEVRVIAATNRDLKREVTEGRFRQDLYYRLNVMHVDIPPLRERPEDIVPLAKHFVRQLAAKLGVTSLDLDDSTVAYLMHYPWPGNARELKNVIERALILGGFPTARVEEEEEVESDPLSDMTMASMEKRHILRVLVACGGNKAEASRRLGLSRKTIDRKCFEWGL